MALSLLENQLVAKRSQQPEKLLAGQARGENELQSSKGNIKRGMRMSAKKTCKHKSATLVSGKFRLNVLLFDYDHLYRCDTCHDDIILSGSTNYPGEEPPEHVHIWHDTGEMTWSPDIPYIGSLSWWMNTYYWPSHLKIC